MTRGSIVFVRSFSRTGWIAGSSPAMTTANCCSCWWLNQQLGRVGNGAYTVAHGREPTFDRLPAWSKAHPSRRLG